MVYTDIGIDMGTSDIVVWYKGKGVIIHEPTMVAYDKEDDKMIAFGEEARHLVTRTQGNIVAIRPFKSGTISDYSVTERLMRHYIQLSMGRHMFRKPYISLCVPSGVTEVERRAVEEAAYQAGASRDKYDGWRGKRQGEFTLEDYYALPEDQQAELIDGVIYDMTAPALTHQQALVFLVRIIGDHIISHKGKCVLSAAPTDVRLDLDDRTMVQPDVLVVCERKQLIRRRVEGAPDLVIEILSPSTRRKDLHIKSGKYARAGVGELWLVDLRDRRIIVYEFDQEDRISLYSIRDQVPVGIFGGELVIDFSELDDYLTDLFGEDWNLEESEISG